MDLSLLLGVWTKRFQLARHERWSATKLAAFQASSLERVRKHAVRHSKFYEKHLKGFESHPLHDWPVVTKEQLMGEFDSAITDPEIKLRDLIHHAESDQAGTRYRGQYWISATSGTTGVRGIFPWTDHEWSWMLATFARAYQWSGVKVGPIRHPKMALVASTAPWHQSALLGKSFASPIVPTLSLDSAAPIESIVAGLNEFQPSSLFAYASMLEVLAGEQSAGRLRINPGSIISCSEPLTAQVRRFVQSIWKQDPFDMYSASETGVIASECHMHRFHLHDDTVITEVVDEKNRPVPPGQCGEKVLVTVLFARTLPLIRYEMSDRLITASEGCACGLPFATISGVEGRAEDVIELPGIRGGLIEVQPNVFHKIMELKSSEPWQIVQRPQELEIRMAGYHPSEVLRAIGNETSKVLMSMGAVLPQIDVRDGEVIQRGGTGKLKLVVRHPGHYA